MDRRRSGRRRAPPTSAALAVVVGIAAAGANAADDSAEVEALSTVPVTDDAVSRATATRLDRITVTGSRIRRVDYETAAPVLIITHEDLARTGHVNVGEFLQQLPEAGSAQNRNINNGGNGQTEFDLRNLGSKRALVLVDGHRWINGVDPFNTTAVDLNSFPISIVERIEVLKDGASAIYGSDAITGVVNIITRKAITGATLNAQWYAYEDGANLTQRYSFTAGTAADDTSALVDLAYLEQRAMFGGERLLSSVPKVGTLLSRGSGASPTGHPIFIAEQHVADALNAIDPLNCPDLSIGAAEAISGQDLPDATIAGALPGCDIVLRAGQTIGSGETLATAAPKYRPWDELSDPYNYAPPNYLLTPFRQQTAFARIQHGLGETAALRGELLFNQFESARHLAETPLLFGDLVRPYPASDAWIHRTQEYNPFGQDIGHFEARDNPANLTQGPGTGIVWRRMVEAGARRLTRTNDVLFLRAALEDEAQAFGSRLWYEVGGSHGSNTQKNRFAGDFDLTRVKKALGPRLECDADPECVALNLFGPPGSVTPAMLDYLTFETSGRARHTATNAYLNAATDLPALARWLAGPMGLALGVEARTEDFAETPDPYVTAGISSLTWGRQPTVGSRAAREAYAEANLPLLHDRPLADELELIAAARYSIYSELDPATTLKGGVRYKPIADLLLRGTWSQAFRAPSITEKFLGATSTFQATFHDPCFNSEERLVDEGLDQNCTEEGSPEYGAATLTPPLEMVFGGNRNLDAERAETWTAGFVWSPAFLDGFTVNADYFRIGLANYIGYLTMEFIIESCYRRAAEAPRPDTCDRVHRDANGSITRIDLTTYNFDRALTSGYDVGLEWALPVRAWLPGSLRWRMDSQYLDRFDTFIATATGPSHRVPEAGLVQGRLGDYPLPRYKATSMLTWSHDRWAASWSTRYLHGYTEPCVDSFWPTLAAFGLCSNPDVEPTSDPDLPRTDHSTNRVAATWYHNAQVSYRLARHEATLVLGIDNVFNQDPPLSFSAAANSYPGTLYSHPESRAPYLRLAVAF